jgi:hypothetical protein
MMDYVFRIPLGATYQNDNGPAKCTKLQESIEKHKKIQDKIKTALIPDLQSLDIWAPQQKSMDDEIKDSATAAAEKQNPMASHLLMRIEKKNMPKVKLFMDVGSNWNNTEYIASFPAAWNDEACFVATNVVAILFHKHGDVGLSFFPEQVWCVVWSQGWNNKEDGPVPMGEEQLNAALKPFNKDLNMLKMYNFCKMEDMSLKSDLQNVSSHPAEG